MPNLFLVEGGFGYIHGHILMEGRRDKNKIDTEIHIPLQRKCDI